MVVLCIALLGAMGGPAQGAQEPAEVLDVRFGVNDDGETRIVLDLSENVKYRVFTRQLSDNRQALGIELEQVSFLIAGTSQAAGTRKGIGHVGTYAFASGEDGRSRVLFDLKVTAVPTSVFLISPKEETENHRLVIDMSDSTDDGFEKSLGQGFGPLKIETTGTASNLPNSARGEAFSDKPSSVVASNAIETAEKAAIAEARQERLLARAPIPRKKPGTIRPTIVVDAGHGGKDPGSIGQTGVKEKDVTLSAAKQLRSVLKARGYKVILTRNGDTYPELEDRIEKARGENADLFLSIHADAATTQDIRGASVYTLSDKGSARMANQVRSEGHFVLHNKDMGTLTTDVREIVLDLSSTDAKNESMVLASIMIRNLSKNVKMVNNTQREANYVVLLSPDVPAVLLELAFISNADDEKNLNSPVWRGKAMLAVADSIDAYFGDKKPVKHAMNITGGQ